MKENDLSEKETNLNEKLIQFNNQKQQTTSNRPTLFHEIIIKIFPCLHHVDQLSKKHIFLKESELNYTYFSNKVENHKYNLISFVPVVIFNQFKQFGNFFYLIMTLTQFVPVLIVGFLFSYLSPLVIVVGVTMIKELYDDINRRYQDRITNNQIYTIYKNNINNEPEEIQVTSANLKIGDFIIINENQRVPADIILLKTFNNDADDNHAFIRTDQLDGETDWKLRKALGSTQKLTITEIINLDAFIEYEAPSKLIYNFEGVFECNIDNNNIIKEPLSLENTLWSSTVLASKKAFGIVCYTGNETRARMNSSEPKIKIGILDDEINKINVYLFFIMCALSAVITIMKIVVYHVLSWNLFFIFFRFIVLFCGIIPISLRVNLDVSKTYFSLMINRDESIKDTIARNSTIPEELGRITYVFTDKTGTLTKNEMIFKKIAMEMDQFSEESFNELNLILDDECKKYDAALLDSNNNNIVQDNESVDTISTNPINKEERRGKKNKRQRTKVIRDTITSMVLCNNVTPIQDKDNPDLYTYQASSPDEVALVKFAETLDMRLIYRSDSEIHIKNKANVIEEYEILANFPFSSDTKRMGIVLKNKKYGHIIFYLKGAENVMTEYVKEEYKGYIKENAESLAAKGLRTLVLTERIVSQNEFDKWIQEYNEALTSMEHRKEKVSQAISKLEKNMDFLCVTGVEDLLQDRVNTTIENLRNAGMKIWMLTGDKIETATCIAISCGLKAKNHTIYSIKYDDFEHEDKDEDIRILKEKLTEYNNLSPENPHIFIIDGDTLDLALKNVEQEFFETAMKAPSVVCCRCSPTQKRIIVKTIKKYTDKRTAAVGDGGNDVAMIQEADVGIGIVGKEGLQASLAADYSILEFNYLDTLLLWWGRLAYKNTSQMSNFIIHRGLIISLIQFIFSCIFYFNSVALYNGMLIMGYSTIYTCFPSISVLLDQDTDKKNVMKFPGLYKNLLMGRELNLKIFLWWFFKSIYQAVVIMFGALYFFQENLFLIIVTITFTCLIFLEILNVYTEINKFHKFMVVSLIGTGFCYLISIYLLPNLLNTAYIWNFTFFWKIGLISIISWSPFYIANRIKKFCFPETIEKLNAIGKDI
jgi:phospholipid-translocating ATPase